jgi:hypothetical protein
MFHQTGTHRPPKLIDQVVISDELKQVDQMQPCLIMHPSEFQGSSGEQTSWTVSEKLHSIHTGIAAGIYHRLLAEYDATT